MCIGVKSPQETPARTAAPWLRKTWQRWMGSAAYTPASPWTLAMGTERPGLHGQRDNHSGKLGSGGGRSKVSMAVATGAPGLGVRPQEHPRALSGWAHEHQQHPTSVHSHAGGDGHAGKERYSTAPACRPPGPAPAPGTCPPTPEAVPAAGGCAQPPAAAAFPPRCRCGVSSPCPRRRMGAG